jgi:hypothetical protein
MYPIQCTSAYCGKAPGYGCDERCKHYAELQAWKEAKAKREALACNCDVPGLVQCPMHGPRE